MSSTPEWNYGEDGAPAPNQENDGVRSGSGLVVDAHDNQVPPNASADTEAESSGIQNPQEHDTKASYAAILGNVLEWYDFAIFGYFSDVIGQVFFPPNQTGHTALIESFVVFGTAFLVRPVGGIIIGLMGDTTGRKTALETSIFLMAIPTFLLGCLPSYATVGWGSVVLLVLVRLLQGLSVGGQLMSSVVFTMERNDVSKWGQWGASVFAFSGVGSSVGSLFSYILRVSLTDYQLRTWGWRLPFWTGALGMLPGFYLKLHAHEHGVPESEHGGSSAGERNVLKESFSKSNHRALISCVLVCAMPAAAFYIIFVWLVMFMEEMVDPPVPHAFAINTVMNIVGIFFTFVGGWIADMYGHYADLMYFSAANLAWMTPLLLHYVGTGSALLAVICQGSLGIILSIWYGAMLPWIVKSFPPSVRLTSVSFAYNLSTGIFGGFSPAIATALASRHDASAPGFFITVLSVFALLGLYIAPKSKIEETSAGGNQPSENGDIQFSNVNAVDVSEHEMT
mmetsp:Transcript_17362/g.23933  ORF Transcript_17362/g.23933 Transcript_17362/m.23933 type:complete len:509 (-) Transcript_17362:323-1849(-)|eukprot:CAMPEP_0185732558 /NCGR_PEP_ID=MMETSP1171-20130828/16633_1 /TAXON_ID=374046 /ORGANISM="Helicotheca tamensis, Strain CCMP826" /LENGTH=508 /DNA_ID=CAMNT_0028402077 /DNA_START=278 /DNA_END=1804 /DNA_ORIENTATION=-